MSAVPKRDQDKPLPIGLNLDTLERETEEIGPFPIVLKAKRYELTDPSELEWGTLLEAAANPAEFLRSALARGDVKQFAEDLNHLPAWKVNMLAKLYREHYGLVDGPESGASSG